MLIDDEFLNTVSEQAKANPRLRMNYNLHDSLEAPAQRLINAVAPGNKFQILRHQNTSAFEKSLTCQYLAKSPEYEGLFSINWVKLDDGARFISSINLPSYSLDSLKLNNSRMNNFN